MSMNWRSIVSLKVQVLIGFVLLWNLGLFYAASLGGGFPEGALTPAGMRATGYVCLLALSFCLAVARLKPIQSLVVAPSRANNFNSKEFYLMALTLGFLTLSRFLFPFGASTDAL